MPVDAVLVEQLLVNLIENAIKYTDPGSGLRVSAGPEEGGVGVEVADEGPGLKPGDEERVFEKFYRGSSAPRGFGLGLAICRKLVEAQGSTLRLETRPGWGTRFFFELELPAHAPALAPAPAPSPATARVH